MIRSMSISLRLAIWYACISFCAIAIFSTIMWFVLGSSVLSWKDRTLDMRATRVNNLLSSSSLSDAESTAVRLNDLVGILPEGELIQIVDGQGRRLFPSLNPETLTLPEHTCNQPVIRNTNVHREYFRVLCQPINFQGQPAYLLVPSSLIEDQILSRTLTLRLFQIAPLLLLISSVGGYTLSRRSLKPVDALTEEAKSITARDLTRRLPIPAANDELRRLALEWNSVLGRIETSVKRIGQFTADASHELRSPIAFIRATAQDSLAHGTFDQGTREALEVIVEETTNTAKLLEDLLMLARADAEHESSSMEVVSLSNILKEARERFVPEAESKGQMINFPQSTGKELDLQLSAVHIRQILGILIDNAIKFTPTGGKISISCRLENDLRLCVLDDGVGISPDHQRFVFDRFFQIDPARTGNRGFGLGLAIAKSLVEQYGGAISMESTLGRGTAMTIVLPSSLFVPAAELAQHVQSSAG